MDIYTEIEIDAPIHNAWQELINFVAYPNWNPVIRGLTASPDLGSTGLLTIKIVAFPLLLPIKMIRFNAEYHEFAWVGNIPQFMAPMGQAEHRFRLVKLGSKRCLLENSETFTGLIAQVLPLAKSLIEEKYHASNMRFKQRVEQMVR